MQKIDLDIKKINESKSYLELKQKLRIKNNNKLFNKLIYFLKTFALYQNSYDNSSFQALININKFISEMISNEEFNDSDYVLKKIIYIKSYYEDLLSDMDKNTVLYIDLELVQSAINDLELQALYNDRASSGKVNLNLVNNIIFNEKNISLSKYLIQKYPYLIDDYNKLSDEKFIDILVDNYLENIKLFVFTSDKKDLYYYDNLLEVLMKSRSTNIVTSATTKKVMNFLSNANLDVKQKERMFLWINHLFNRLTSASYTPGIETLNHLYGVRFYFKKAILDEGNIYGFNNEQKIREELSIRTDRKVSDDYILTIDEDGTYDKDDAISVKSLEGDILRISVHISDPNSFASLNSLLMLEARKRSESIYLEDKVINMFPEEIIKNNLSLDKDKYRFARTYTYDIDRYGNIVGFDINKSIVKSNKSFSYDRFNEILNEGADNPKLEDTIIYLREVYDRLTKYFKNNKIFIKTGDINSESLIQLIMIFNNFMVAKYFSDRDYPFIYRCHQLNMDLQNYKLSLEELNPKNRKKYMELLKRMEKINLPAEYSTERLEHESMDLKSYSTCTSPIRRYADIIANDCEDKFIFSNISDEEAYAFEDTLKEDIKYLNKRSKEINNYYDRYSRIRK